MLQDIHTEQHGPAVFLRMRHPFLQRYPCGHAMSQASCSSRASKHAVWLWCSTTMHAFVAAVYHMARLDQRLDCSGGGVALLYASRGLDSMKEKLTNFDQQVGVQIVQNALKVPLKTIADNAGKPSCH